MLTQSEILKIISKALDDGSGSAISISIEDSMATVSEWDSLGHLSILSALDKNLNATVMVELEYLKSDVNRLLSLLKQTEEVK